MSATRRSHGVLLIALGAGVWIGLRQLSPPDTAPASAPPTAFSAERAVRHLDVIATEPRPVASPGHAAVRAYILAQLRALGLEPEVQAAVTASRFPGAPSFNAASVNNIIARLPGSASTGTIVLDAHYDGGATGPAAGDCGACVVTLLETARALRAGPPLRNDVVLVFADAEEVGDLGAHAFATQHPWMRRVRIALNFESMGAGGSASLYVTSTRNGRLIDAFASVAPDAVGSSFFAGLLGAFPSMRAACDLQDYMDAGSAGLGFIFAGNTPAYHTALDDPAVLDARSVQHFGGYALGLVRHFGDADLETAANRRRDAVFFTVWPGVVVHYSIGWALPLAMLAAMLALAAAVFGEPSVRVRSGRASLGAVAFLATIVVTVIVVQLVWIGIRAVNLNLHVFLVGHYATPWYLAGLLALSIACVATLLHLQRRWIAAEHQAGGALLGLALLALVAALLFPAGSYVVTWPLLAAVPAVALLTNAPRVRAPRWMRLASVGIAIVVATVVLAPIGVGPLLGLLSRIEGLMGLPVLGVATVFVTLLAALLIPMWELAVRDQPVPQPAAQATEASAAATARRLVANGWTFPAGAFALSLLLLAYATVSSGFDAEHPRPSEVHYELDADQGAARWVTSDDQLGEWTLHFMPPGTPRNSSVRHGVPWANATHSVAAPLADLEAPDVEVREDVIGATMRSLRLRLASRRAAPMLEVHVAGGGRIESARVAGVPLDLHGYAPALQGKLTFFYHAPPAIGVELELRVHGAGAVRIEIADWSDGFPALPGWDAPRRPPATMAQPGGRLDGTRVRRSVLLAGAGDGAQ